MRSSTILLVSRRRVSPTAIGLGHRHDKGVLERVTLQKCYALFDPTFSGSATDASAASGKIREALDNCGEANDTDDIFVVPGTWRSLRCVNPVRGPILNFDS